MGSVADRESAATLIARAADKFAGVGAGLSGRDKDITLAKHVHTVLLGMKVSPEDAWKASGLSLIVG